MDPEELDSILLHDITKSLAKQSYLHGWDYEGQQYKDTCDIFESMETAETIYKGGEHSKNIQQADFDRDSFGKKQKGGRSSLSSNPKKVCTVNCKRSNAVNPIEAPTHAKKIWMLHGPSQSSEKWKVLQEYSEKHVAQQPFKDKQSCSRGNKRSKTVRFESVTEEAKIIKYHDDPIPVKKK